MTRSKSACLQVVVRVIGFYKSHKVLYHINLITIKIDVKVGFGLNKFRYEDGLQLNTPYLLILSQLSSLSYFRTSMEKCDIFSSHRRCNHPFPLTTVPLFCWSPLSFQHTSISRLLPILRHSKPFRHVSTDSQQPFFCSTISILFYNYRHENLSK